MSRDRATPRVKTAARPRRSHRGWWIALGVVVGILVVLQFGASPVAKSVLNRKLSDLGAFHGQVGQVKLALWRDRVELHDLVLRSREHPDEPPVVAIRKLALSGAARPLLEGKLGGHATMEGAEFNIVKRKRFEDPVKEAEKKAEKFRPDVKRWQHELREAFPMELTEFELRDGQARFIDEAYDPKVDVGISRLHVVARNLRNRPDGEALPTTIDLTGVTTGNGQLRIHVRSDPLKEPLEFFTTFELKALSLPEFNNFMRAYAKVDVSAGTFEVYNEITAANGRYDGYVKPFFQNLEFESLEDEEKSVGRRIVEKVATAAKSLLENEETQKMATQIPFSGTFDQNQVDLWETVENLLSNAFIQAIREGLEGYSPRPASADAATGPSGSG
jgi:hypothetical protein